MCSTPIIPLPMMPYLSVVIGSPVSPPDALLVGM